MVFVLGLLVAVVGLAAWYRFGRRSDGDHRLVGLSRRGALAAAVVAAVLALTQVLTVVPAGHVGVVDFFGHVLPGTLKSGINFVNPLANVHKFSVKTQEIKEVLEVPSREGLTIQLEASVLFHLDPEKAAEVYRSIGPNYVEILVVPQFRSVARGVTASFEARALYTSEREMLAEIILRDLQKALEPRGVVAEATMPRKVSLPAGLTQAIEEKLRAEQESQRMEFVLLKEKQEAERKRIEARGIADFQDIVTKGISEPLLRWKGIEATEKLASSANAKVVVIGAGKDGLPLILDSK